MTKPLPLKVFDRAVSVDGAISSASSQPIKDASAGFLVLLTVLPISLGIALAPKFSASLAIIAAIVGSIVTSLIGGAMLMINAQAMGLIARGLGAVSRAQTSPAFMSPTSISLRNRGLALSVRSCYFREVLPIAPKYCP